MTKRRKTSSSKKKTSSPNKAEVLKKKKIAKTAFKPNANVATKAKTSKSKIIPRNNSKKSVKKRRKPSKKELRQRALKGWETRRKFQHIEPTKVVQNLVTDVILPEIRHKASTRELIEELSKYRVDGSIALEPSILRHVTDREVIYERLWRTQSAVDGMIAASTAEIAATEEFRFEANKISQDYEVPIREVYTLFFSP